MCCFTMKMDFLLPIVLTLEKSHPLIVFTFIALLDMLALTKISMFLHCASESCTVTSRLKI